MFIWATRSSSNFNHSDTGGEVLNAIYGNIIVLIIQFLISSALTDLSMRLFYKVKFDQDIPEFAKKYRRIM